MSIATVQRNVLAIELSTPSWATLDKGGLQDSVAHIVKRDAAPGVCLSSDDPRDIIVDIDSSASNGIHSILVAIPLDSHESSAGALQSLMNDVKNKLPLVRPQLLINQIGFQ